MTCAHQQYHFVRKHDRRPGEAAPSPAVEAPEGTTDSQSAASGAPEMSELTTNSQFRGSLSLEALWRIAIGEASHRVAVSEFVTAVCSEILAR